MHASDRIRTSTVSVHRLPAVVLFKAQSNEPVVCLSLSAGLPGVIKFSPGYIQRRLDDKRPNARPSQSRWTSLSNYGRRSRNFMAMSFDPVEFISNFCQHAFTPSFHIHIPIGEPTLPPITFSSLDQDAFLLEGKLKKSRQSSMD